MSGLPWWSSGASAGGPGLIPGQGTRSHMHAATKSSHAATKRSPHAATKRIPHAAVKIPRDATKTRCSQNK